MKTVAGTLLVFVLVSCISGCTTSSGAVPIGLNTYMISRTEKGLKGTSGSVKAAALKEANRHCEESGKTMKVIRTVQKDMKPFRSDAAAEVTFQCLESNDPDLKRPIPIDEIRE